MHLVSCTANCCKLLGHLCHLTGPKNRLQVPGSARFKPKVCMFQVADFGLSRVCDEAQIETKTYGTVTHMPPELLLDGNLSKSADVYAYGVLLFELFTAERPWNGLRHAEVLHKVAVKKERLQLPEDAPQLFKVGSSDSASSYTSFAALPHHRQDVHDTMDVLD